MVEWRSKDKKRLEDLASPGLLIKREIPMKKEILFQYNKEYFKTISDVYEKTAKKMNKVRWDFVKETKPKIVLDYGAGANFLTKFAPKGIKVDSFDIGNFSVKYTGIRHKKYDLVFLSDVLEHIPDFSILDDIFKMTDYFYISTPVLPESKKLRGWKHFKFETKEHLHYFTKRSLDLFFEARGFKNIKSGYPEVECGLRKDIYSAVYKKEVVVFTNGVYDILHSGHIHSLKEAKKLGDILIVGLNSDKSSTKIKRKPIKDEKERKEILESIKYVDKVEIFDELNPLLLIKKIRPNILVKGGDYKKEDIVGYKFLKSYGGQTKTVSYLKGHSTTNLINKIK